MKISGLLEIKKGAEAGKRLVVMVGTHGNEPCGIKMLEKKLSSISIQRGEVYFVLGNPRAVEENKRFLEQDLNRMFKPETEYSEEKKSSYEYKRAQELKPLLSSCDALLDIHSSGTKNTVPFIICEPHSFEIAKELPFEIVSHGWDDIEAGGTDYFVNTNGGKGICVECGYHNDPAATERAWESLQAFLIINNAIDGELSSRVEQKIINANYLYKTKNNFILERAFADFGAIKEGDLIGTDGEEKIYAPKDGVIIFARNRDAAGEEAFIVGEVSI